MSAPAPVTVSIRPESFLFFKGAGRGLVLLKFTQTNSRGFIPVLIAAGEGARLYQFELCKGSMASSKVKVGQQ